MIKLMWNIRIISIETNGQAFDSQARRYDTMGTDFRFYSFLFKI